MIRAVYSDIPTTDTRPRLTLLAPFHVEWGGAHVRLPVAARRLVAVLALRGPMHRAALAGELWPDVPEDRARGSLRTTLWRLGRTDVPLVEARPDMVAVADSVEVDVAEFRALATSLTSRTVADGPELRAFTDMSGELLPGWYDDWVLFERERLRQIRLHTLETVASRLLGLGLSGRAIEVGLEVVQLDPLRESAQRVLIAAHLHEDNLGEAMRHYIGFRELLGRELAIAPSARLTQMVADRLPSLLHTGTG
jgi:DNA-binding SARP family transcriptional activator